MVVIETINIIGYGSKVSTKGMADVIVIPAAIILYKSFPRRFIANMTIENKLETIFLVSDVDIWLVRPIPVKCNL
ncbi:hypothetical protein C0J52_05423 [Blattella germanica]|nr:hypothetical protein C0J52_05423 [Blattella germanica]